MRSAPVGSHVEHRGRRFIRGDGSTLADASAGNWLAICDGSRVVQIAIRDIPGHGRYCREIGGARIQLARYANYDLIAQEPTPHLT